MLMRKRTERNCQYDNKPKVETEQMEIDLHKNKEHAIKRLKNENRREIKLRDKLNEAFDCKDQ